MGKKKNRNFGKMNGDSFMGARPVTIPFRGNLNIAIGSTLGTVTTNTVSMVSGNIDARITPIAKLFSKWRLIKLKLYIVQDGFQFSTGTAPAASLGAACEFISGYAALDTAYITVPSTEIMMLDLATAKQGNGLFRMVHDIPVASLRKSSPYKWLETSQHGSIPVLQQSAGCLVFMQVPRSNNCTGFISIVIDGLCQFRDPIGSSQLVSPEKPWKGMIYKSYDFPWVPSGVEEKQVTIESGEFPLHSDSSFEYVEEKETEKVHAKPLLVRQPSRSLRK